MTVFISNFLYDSKKRKIRKNFVFVHLINVFHNLNLNSNNQHLAVAILNHSITSSCYPRCYLFLSRKAQNTSLAFPQC